MFGNFTVAFLGAILFTIWGDQSVTILWTGSGLFGAGMASMFATAVLWVGSHIEVTNAIGKYSHYFWHFYVETSCTIHTGKKD